MKRHPSLVRLSWDHHHGLVLALRIEREVPDATAAQLANIYGDVIAYWARGLLPHFHAETDCLLARLVSHLPIDDPRVVRLNTDHLGIANFVARMRDATATDERRALISAFGARLRDHIRWEETDLFTAVEEQLGAAELDRLGAELVEALPPVEPAPGSPE